MFRRFVYTLLGAMAGYLVGAVVGMTAFSAIYGYRSISILEESNRNRWTFVAASAAAVAGGLIGWWRSYTDDPAPTRDPEPPATGDPEAEPGDAKGPAAGDADGTDEPDVSLPSADTVRDADTGR